MTEAISPFLHAVPADCALSTALAGHIAIVDDDEPLRRALARLIRISSYQAKTYASGPGFLASLATGIPACLVLDLQMIEMTGLELAHCLTAMGIRIPTVFITAREEPNLEHLCRAAGGAALLIKPITGDQLLAAIHTATAKVDSKH